jgi:hypothetical protein
MPKHTYWFTYILDMFPALKANAQNLGDSIIGHEHPSYRSGEPVLTAFVYIAVLLLLALVARGKLRNLDASAVPSDKLTLTTFFEVFIGYFYDMAKDVMGPANAKKFFPIIGGSALFIIFSNLIGLVPGFGSPTSSLNVTLGCAIVVFVVFNYYGLEGERPRLPQAHGRAEVVPRAAHLPDRGHLDLRAPRDARGPSHGEHRGRPPARLDLHRPRGALRTDPDHVPRDHRLRRADHRLLSAHQRVHRSRDRARRGASLTLRASPGA